MPGRPGALRTRASAPCCWWAAERIAPPTPTPEPVTINFAFPAQLGNYYDERIQTFNEEHPSLTVQRKTARSEGTWNSFFQNGEVDVFMFLSEDDLFSNLYEQDQVLNLSPLVQANDTIDLDDLYPSLLEPYTHRGQPVGHPGGVKPGRDLLQQGPL